MTFKSFWIFTGAKRGPNFSDPARDRDGHSVSQSGCVVCLAYSGPAITMYARPFEFTKSYEHYFYYI
jgi:hypothetical protein